MKTTLSPEGPAYPLKFATTRIFGCMAEAMRHYCQYQYVRCVMHEMEPGGRVLMTVHS